jgi:hypothetical protein
MFSYDLLTTEVVLLKTTWQAFVAGDKEAKKTVTHYYNTNIDGEAQSS